MQFVTNAPYFQGLTFFGHDVGIGGVGSTQLDSATLVIETLYGKGTIHNGHHHVVPGADGLIDDQNVVMKDAIGFHGLPETRCT
ncbi:hypothetical protein MCEMSEM22_02189 [Comamonadaceae bacterium]